MAAAKEVQPLAVSQVDKVAKARLANGTVMQKQARVALHRAAHMFIMYTATMADDVRKAQKKKRTTLTAVDVETAVEEAGFAANDATTEARKRER